MSINFILKALRRNLFYALWVLLDPSKFKRIEPSKIKRILVINLGFIGDLLATTPMIAALKRKFRIKPIVLVRKGMEEVFVKNLNVDKVLIYQDNFEKDLAQIKKQKAKLAVIVWPTSFRISSLCKQAGIPYRIGTTQTGLLEQDGYFLTRKVKPSFEKHKVQENLDISKLVGADVKNPKIDFYFSKKDEEAVSKFLKKNKAKKPLIIIHPGKRGKFYAEYSWSLEKFAKVSDYLAERYKATIIITGAKDEEKIAKQIASKMKNKAIIASGKLTLKQFGALLKKANLLISIDTAAVHIASAFDTPIVMINAKYPKIWHPYMPKDKYKLLQKPGVEGVIKASKELIK